LVDPPARPVESPQRRRMLVGLESPGDRLPPAHDLPERPRPLFGPLPALAAQRLGERPVRGEQIHILERRRLIEDGVGGEGIRGHGGEDSAGRVAYWIGWSPSWPFAKAPGIVRLAAGRGIGDRKSSVAAAAVPAGRR